MKARKLNRPIRTAAFLALLVLPLDTFAQDLETRLKNCAAIQGQSERLECYDNLSELQPQMSQELPDQTVAGGEWELTRETSPIDDSEIVYLSLVASETTPTAPGVTSPTLFIRCKEKNLESFR